MPGPVSWQVPPFSQGLVEQSEGRGVEAVVRGVRGVKQVGPVQVGGQEHVRELPAPELVKIQVPPF